MARTSIQKVLRRSAQTIPPDTRRVLRRKGGAVLRRMPTPVAQEIRDLFGVKWGQQKNTRAAGRATDALGLATAEKQRPRAAASPTVTGRGAAAVGPDPKASERLERALGLADVSRGATGQRSIGGILAPDVRGRLEEAGHRVVPFVPGTSTALAQRVESVVVDLEGFRGVWAGALDATGVSLYRELDAALKAASERGVTCWLLVRGPRAHRIGALALMQAPHVLPLRAGEDREPMHFTEDPGDAPYGLADVLSASEEAYRG